MTGGLLELSKLKKNQIYFYFYNYEDLSHNLGVGPWSRVGSNISLCVNSRSLSRISDDIARITDFSMVLNSLPMPQNVYLVA